MTLGKKDLLAGALFTPVKKEDLLAYVLFTPDSPAFEAVHQAAQQKMVEMDLVDVGLSPFPVTTRIADHVPTSDNVYAWMNTVRQPHAEQEFADKATRNQLVYEVERFGEFAKTLQSRVTGTLPDYNNRD